MKKSKDLDNNKVLDFKQGCVPKESFSEALERIIKEPQEEWVKNAYVAIWGYDPSTDFYRQKKILMKDKFQITKG